MISLFLFPPLSRLVHSGPGKGSPQVGVDLSFATRTGTRQGIETHLFRAETSRDLSHWTRSIVQGCHNSAELITEITTGGSCRLWATNCTPSPLVLERGLHVVSMPVHLGSFEIPEVNLDSSKLKLYMLYVLWLIKIHIFIPGKLVTWVCSFEWLLRGMKVEAWTGGWGSCLLTTQTGPELFVTECKFWKSKLMEIIRRLRLWNRQESRVSRQG